MATWGHDPGTPGLSIWTEELDAAGAASDPRDGSVMQHALMDSPAKLEGLLASAGLGAAKLWTARYERPWSLERLLGLHVYCAAPARRLPSLPMPERAACVARVRHRMAQLTDTERIHAVEVLYAVATTPSRRARTGDSGR